MADYTPFRFYLYNGTSWIEITNYVEVNAKFRDTLDETFNELSFNISHIKADTIQGLDLSKPIKPWTPIKITLNTDVYRFFTSDSSRTIIKKTDPKLYKHEIKLVEATKILQRKTIPNITVTQPKTEQFASNIVNDLKGTTLTVNNSYITPILNTINETIYTNIIEDNIIKAGVSDSRILLSLDVINYQYNYFNLLLLAAGGFGQRDDAEVNLQVEILINDIVQSDFTQNIFINPATANGGFLGLNPSLDEPYKNTYNFTFYIPQSESDQTITIRYKTLGNYTIDYLSDNQNYIEDSVDVLPRLSITSGDALKDNYKFCDDIVDKILDLIDLKDINDTNENPYKLDENTRAMITGVLMPEVKFEDMTVWDILEKIAKLFNAIPELKDDYKTITFSTFDERPDTSYDQSLFIDEVLAYSLENYVTGLESNTSNLLEEDNLLNAKTEPYEDGWMSVRADSEGITQIKEDNSAYKVRQPIQRIYKMFIKGVGVQITDGTTTTVIYGNIGDVTLQGSYWDISDRVVEKTRWDVYPDVTYNKSDASRLANNTQGNFIYYQQGDKYIKGLGHTTLTTDDLIGTTTSARSLMEVIMCEAAQYISNNQETYPDYYVVTATDGDPERGLDGDYNLFKNVLARITYESLTDSRSTVYKYNIYDEGLDITNFINEQETLNDSNNLGVYISKTLNKQGNLQYTVSGRASYYDSIPKLGWKTYNNLYITSRDLTLNSKNIEYELTLSENFVNQSELIGRKSAYRQYEISRDDITFRQDKYREFVILTKDPNSLLPLDYTMFSTFGKQMIVQNFCNLIGASNIPLSYVKGTITTDYGLSNTIEVDLPINGYSLDRTLNLQIQFDNNYSAGPNINGEYTDINNIPVLLQDNVDYTDFYGKFYSIKYEFYPRGYLQNTATDADKYPLYYNDPSDELYGTLELKVNKDARETYGTNIEIPFITDDYENIIIYNGLTKYNGLIRPKDGLDIGVGLIQEGYRPTLNSYKVDTSKIKVLDDEADYLYSSTYQAYGIYYGNLNIEADTKYDGYIVYEKNTNDLIYVVFEDIPESGLPYDYQTDVIWFLSKKNLNDRTRPTE